jgi:hypothetical protein
MAAFLSEILIHPPKLIIGLPRTDPALSVSLSR